MADLRDEFGNPIQLTDEHGNTVQLKDEHGNPMHLTGIAVTQEKIAAGSVLPGHDTIDSGDYYVGHDQGQNVMHDPGLGENVMSGPGLGENVMSGPGCGVMTGPPGVYESGEKGMEHVEEQHQQQEHRSSSSSSEDDGQGGRIKKKKGLKQKIKEKLTGGKSKDDAPASTAKTVAPHPDQPEKKSMMEKIKEKLPGHHNQH